MQPAARVIILKRLMPGKFFNLKHAPRLLVLYLMSLIFMSMSCYLDVIASSSPLRGESQTSVCLGTVTDSIVNNVQTKLKPPPCENVNITFLYYFNCN